MTAPDLEALRARRKRLRWSLCRTAVTMALVVLAWWIASATDPARSAAAAVAIIATALGFFYESSAYDCEQFRDICERQATLLDALSADPAALERRRG